MKKLICHLLLIPLIISCENDESGPEFPTEEKEIVLSTESIEMVSSDNQFGIEFFKEIIAIEPDKNLMISPLSLSQALLMTYNGAAGDTKSAFEETLFLNNLTTEEVNQAQKDLVEALLEVDPSIIISIANSIWFREGLPVKPEFITVNQNYHDAEVREELFDQNTVNLINSWVNDKTNGKIDEIIDSIDPLTVMFLINAVYFKGNWKFEFDEENTVDNDFYLSNGNTIEVPFMNREVTASVMYYDIFQMLELPYGRGNYSMLILLPNNGKSVNDVIEELDTESYNEWLLNLQESNVEVSIPKFKFKYEKKLNDLLKSMGLSVAFDPDNADFSNISEALELYISKVKHKTFIEVNEKGTEAAAVTVVSINTTSADPTYPKFIANKPFLFVIREKYTNSILFMGKVEDPSKE